MDPKLHSFLTLCQTMNYRLAAQRLHLSQPAVTKQIHSLEQTLQTKLFYYDGHTLHKTETCLLLERYAISQQCQFEELQLAIAGRKRKKLPCRNRKKRQNPMKHSRRMSGSRNRSGRKTPPEKKPGKGLKGQTTGMKNAFPVMRRKRKPAAGRNASPCLDA